MALRMQRRVVRSSESLRDVVELADFIARSNLDAALRFLDAVEATYQFLIANPDVGQLCRFDNPETEGLRVWPVERFPNHLVFYRSTNDGVVVERVLHGARDIEALFGERPRELGSEQD
jgi:toxin ParE1/3/4